MDISKLFEIVMVVGLVGPSTDGGGGRGSRGSPPER